MYENQPHLELWFPSIRKYLYKTAGKQMELAGFKFNKSEFSFKKKHGKDYEQICFILQNQFPLCYKISFVLKIWNHEIKTIKASLPFKHQIEDFKYRSIALFMGHFIEEMKLPRLKQGQIYDYTIMTNKDLFAASDKLSELLHEQVLPLSNQLCNMEGIDSFFASRPDWSVNNLTLNNITTELIAAKLNKKRNYDDVFWQIREAIGLKIASGEMSLESRIVIEQLYKYLKNDS
jgi:hypothetical protein